MRVLDVGCGNNKYPGAIGLDRNPNTRADVIADLDQFPFPFADSAFQQLRAMHVIEHVGDVIRTMEEFHRLLAPGGRLLILTPHYTDFSSFCDPTHKWHLNSFSLRYFGDDNAGYGYYSAARFREISTHVKLLALWRYLGFELLVNRSRRFRKFWEYYLCYIVRGKLIEWELEALKGLKWALQPKQILWKLSDRARQLGESHTLNPTVALGKRGEDLAHRYLQRAGYKVIARNYKPGQDSEVDIVARMGELLIFVEVKTRTSDEHSAPERAVDQEKERHILRAARAFVTRAGLEWVNVRFDIVSIVMGDPPTIVHREDAFC